MTQSTPIPVTNSLYRPIPVTNRRHGHRSIMQQFAVVLAMFVSCQVLPLQAHADVVSTFDANLEGWTQFQNSGPNFSWIASGGSPAGHLGVTDNTNDWAYVQAPSSYLTPARYNGTFSFDLKHDNLQEPPGYPGIFNVRVGMQMAGLTLINEGALPTLSWARYSFLLNESAGAGWRKFSNLSQNYTTAAPLATLAEMQSVLGGMSRLVIATDSTWASTASNSTQIDRTYIDNVRLTTVPEPSGLTLLGIGSVLCLASRRRSRTLRGQR
ncbi:MAG: PEP-CTERM sorting domain-containing protein [Pirellulaceae bacterium]